MSQHRIFIENSRGQFIIQAGWDKPLKGFYAVIEKVGDENYVYSNLYDKTLPCSHPSSFDPFEDRIAELGFALPARMVAEIHADARNDVVSKVVYWHVKGYRSEEPLHASGLA